MYCYDAHVCLARRIKTIGCRRARHTCIWWPYCCDNVSEARKPIGKTPTLRPIARKLRSVLRIVDIAPVGVLVVGS